MKLKVFVGIVISAVFIYVTFHGLEFSKMLAVLRSAQYLWLVPAFLVMLVSHWLRALRWGYILEPIKRMKVHPIFSALMIGYAANNVFPLRMGEFLRAFAIGKSQKISKSSALATVVIERLILDFVALLVILAATILLFPTLLPQEIKSGGYLVFIFTIAAIVLIVFLIEKTSATVLVLESILPRKLFDLVQKILPSFAEGCMVFKKSEHYVRIIILSILVWILYVVSIYLSFFVFDFPDKFGLDVKASLVVLIFVTFGIMIPSSPGYIGTFHFFCALSLTTLNIPEGEAKTFALISHFLNVLPISVIGLVYFWRENLHFSDAIAERELVEHEIEAEELVKESER